ncbi:E3 ubiquitin-protein ligase hecw-1 isoform X1 [Solenopsis invicta]|uniref:E3 ubiquitin-protein ligase hecw-1 isoform X1 n=1 Tax=Solenopsis invicta TaxID=13686 RepID=UPI00193E3439|nr:E3 ubiquitin-protein ligase hecw-1 isoform X1 [Solenopsis invicta]XP_039303839.1 E3 ubiquitin-protein ligase hecw-1 isoform X1 [Solenopsis invicta]
MQATRKSFSSLYGCYKPSSFRSQKGRPKQSVKKCTFFLLRRSNHDYFPCASECNFLTENGFGKKIIYLTLNWKMTRVKKHICEKYLKVQLKSVGFRFGKCARDKKITLLTVNTPQELINKVKGQIIIIPNRDLSCSDYDINVDTSHENSSTQRLGHNRHNRFNIRSYLEQLNSRQGPRFNNNYRDSGLVTTQRCQDNMRNRQRNTGIMRRVSVDTQSNTRLQQNNQSDDGYQVQNDSLLNRRVSYQNEFALDLSNLDNFSYIPEANQELTSQIDIKYPDLPNGEININFIIKRENIIKEMLDLYKDESVVQKKINVAFKDELELNYGDLTKELFSEFWKKIMPEFFKGENRSVPFLSLSKMRKGLDENFPIIGRILAHTIILTKSIPTNICKSIYLKLGSLDKEIKQEILLEDLFQFITPVEQRLIYKAKNSFDDLNISEKDMLLDFFATYGLLENPEKSQIENQLCIIAKNILCIESHNLIKKIKDGIPLFCEKFFTDLTDSKVNLLFEQMVANPNKVVTVLKTDPEELNNIQTRIFYFFKTYIKNLPQDNLLKLLLFVTASSHLPDKITVSFKTSGFPVAHTCSNTLELPTTYSSYQELKNHFDLILENENSFQYT